MNTWINKIKMKKTTQKKKENKWKTGTFVLLGVILILIAYSSYNSYSKFNGWKSNICSEITGTPSWVDNEGDIIKSGYIQLISKSYSNETERDLNYKAVRILLKEALINEKITFVYRDGCSWCEKQIDKFKEVGFWEEYKNSGLTKSC